MDVRAPQYHFLDESGDPGLDDRGCSSHFALAMVEMTERALLPELAALRKALHLPATLEFKYYKTRAHQKEAFFETVQAIPFRVRAVVIDKSRLEGRFDSMRGQDLMIEFIARLILRAKALDLANDVLIMDGATQALLRALRIRLSRECYRLERVRPFKKIVSGVSNRDDGLQLADMIAGATSHYVVDGEIAYYRTFANKVVDLWEVS